MLNRFILSVSLKNTQTAFGSRCFKISNRIETRLVLEMGDLRRQGGFTNYNSF